MNKTQKNRTYRIWHNMKSRCHNKNHNSYKKYGAKGIYVCEEWFNSFDVFLEDMGEAPKDHSLDRKNSSENYCKENCKWSTIDEQNRNKSNNLYVTYKGETKLLIEFCEELGIKYVTAFHRYKRYGWDIDKTLSTPVKTK